MDKKEKELQETLQKVAESYDEEVKESILNVATNIFVKGVKPVDAFAISKTKMEGIYAQAYQLYNSGNFEKAYQTFEMLNLLDGESARYAFGAGACLQGLGKYKEAFLFFMQSGALDVDNPVPFYHAADCSLQLNDKFSAVVMCQLVEDRSADREEYTYIRERSRVLKEKLTKELNEEGAKLREQEKMTKN